jgi:hypothetical protein
MKRRRGSIKWAVIALCSLVGLALLVLCPLGLLYSRRLDQTRTEFASPTVYITEPLPGAEVEAGTHLLISATAVGDTPIYRAELWLDGQVVDTQDVETTEATSTYYAHFGFLVREGPQQIVVRAVNTAGIIGQSLPVAVLGQPGPGMVCQAVLVGPGETLDDIALARDVEPQTLRDLNPELGAEEPAEGSVIIVPAPPEEAPSQSAGPTLPPAGTGTSPTFPGGGAVIIPAGPPLTAIPPSIITTTIPIIPMLVAHLEPPKAPDGLQGGVENCMVRLRWNDNADNEMRYEVWMAPLAGPARLIATLSPAAGGAAWFEFAAPQTGGMSFWVEAVGTFGSQPSNLVWVEVDPKCPTRAPAHLEVELRDMSTRGSYDKAYCYVSLENAPEVRLPSDESSFIQVHGGHGDVSAGVSGIRRLAVPIPADGALDLQGECWGWAGEALDKLGNFSGSSTSSQWDGTRLSLAGGGYEIGYSVTSTSAAAGTGEEATYSYEDPTLPTPYGLSLLGKSIPGLPGFSSTTLYWDWSGDQSKLTGFTVFLNAHPYTTVSGGDKRGVQVQLPTACGKTYKWQVAALAGDAQSPFSASYDFHTEPCPVFVNVQFKELDILCSENYWFHWTCPNCGEVGAWWTLYANDQQRKSYYSNLRLVIKCGTYQMSHIDSNKGDTLVVPVSASDPTLKVGSRFYYMNHWGEPRDFQYASRTLTMSLDQWKTYDEEFELWTKGDGVYSHMTVRVRGPDAGGSSQ